MDPYSGDRPHDVGGPSVTDLASLDPLQLDLATVVARLTQIQRAGGFDASSLVAEVAERVLTCDLPRLRDHLSAEARTLVEEALSDG